MATTLDTILVEFGAQWTGGGVINRMITDISRVSRATKELYNPAVATGLVKDMGSQSTAFATAAAEALKYQAAIKGIEGQFGQLGRALAGIDTDIKKNPFVGISAEEGARTYQSLALQSNKFKQELAAISTQAGGTTSSINRFVTALAPVAVAAGAAAGALYLGAKAFNAYRAAAEEGAGIRQTAKSFEYLTESVYNVPGLLDQLRRASRGTISDLDLMSSYLTMIAGTTPEFGARMSAAAPQILEIAKAASTLNPTLGDTTFFFESLSRGLKRTEYRLIDNLGLNVRVGEANRTYAAALGKTVQQLTAAERQQAFLNEVLRVGGQLIQQIGGDVSSLTDPYQQFTANTENLKNSLKELASISFTPIARELAETSGVWSEFVNNLVTGIKKIEDAQADDGATGAGGVLDNITSDLRRFIPFVGPALFAFDKLTQGISEFNDLIDTLRSGGTFMDFWLNQTEGPALSAPFQGIKNDFAAADAAFAAFNQRADRAIELLRDGKAVVEQFGKALPVTKTQEMANAFIALSNAARGMGLPKLAHDFSDAASKVDEMAAAMQRLNGFMAVEMRGPWQNINREQMQQQVDLIEQMRAGWAALDAERNQGISNSWLDAFGGGEFDSEYVVGSIRNIGWALVQTGGAVQQHGERWEELSKEYERAKEKLWDLQNGIGTQGDKTEAVTKRIADQAAEVANYERILGELTTTMSNTPITTERRWIGLNLDDVAIFKEFIQLAGQGGATAAQLSQMGVAMGLFGEATGDAMQKVALIDTILKNLNLDLQAGNIDVSDIPAAISGAIAALEQNLPIQEIMAQVRVNMVQAQATVDREMRLPEEDRTRELSVGANMNPAMRAIAEATGMIRRTTEEFQVDADDAPARRTFDALRSEIENTTLYIDIHGRYTAPDNMPTSSTTSTRPIPSGNTNTPHSLPNGYSVKALDALGAPVISSGKPNGGNSVSLQNYFYAPVGMSQAREVIVKASDDAAAQLVDVLKRNGYKI